MSILQNASNVVADGSSFNVFQGDQINYNTNGKPNDQYRTFETCTVINTMPPI